VDWWHGGRTLFKQFRDIQNSLTGYRIELGIGWFGGYDGYDLAALSLLSHGPPVS
jgi:hypothetical protein